NENNIRKFVYDFDIINNVQQIWEYGQGGKEVSHVALSMAPEDKLYTNISSRINSCFSLSQRFRTGCLFSLNVTSKWDCPLRSVANMGASAIKFLSDK
ncbi:MAG: hypothetical protein QF814_08990, partial [Candidatus Marinimicrobia bacterium]|nr:hypothetical protein [Candidatus Neomarinimicrobiota bacterium]